jgi:hypothetical protein
MKERSQEDLSHRCRAGVGREAGATSPLAMDIDNRIDSIPIGEML